MGSIYIFHEKNFWEILSKLQCYIHCVICLRLGLKKANLKCTSCRVLVFGSGIVK